MNTIWLRGAVLTTSILVGGAALAQNGRAMNGATLHEALGDLREQGERGELDDGDVVARLGGRGLLSDAQTLLAYMSLEPYLDTQGARIALVDALEYTWRGADARSSQTLAYLHLRAAGADGRITAAELDAAAASMREAGASDPLDAIDSLRTDTTFTEALARGATPTPSPRRRSAAAGLELGNSTLARLYPDMQALVDAILREHFPGQRPRWSDENGDGVIDADDRVLGIPARSLRSATGALGVVEHMGLAPTDEGPESANVGVRVGDALARRALIQVGLVKGSDALVDSSGRGRLAPFETGAGRFDRDHFKLSGRAYMLQRGVSASQALDHLFGGPEAYAMECASAITVVQHYAVRDAMHTNSGTNAAFDERFAFMRLGRLSDITMVLRDSRLAAGPDGSAPGAQSKQPQIGDHVYFLNPNATAAERAGGWNGENAIYLGDDTYFSHPFGIGDAQSILDALKPGAHRLTVFYRIVPGAFWP